MDRRTHRFLELILLNNPQLSIVESLQVTLYKESGPTVAVIVNSERGGNAHQTYLTKRGARSGALDVYNYFKARKCAVSFHDNL
mgnify:FL=1